ncbi:hypothetical protein KW805_01325 [Candidatus Pacearchaeota archaeon]|nr:hypothetical protein [Candidatus Pacearchaeota archaeon]
MGSFISTYTGKNEDPLPSFNGEPIRMNIPGRTASYTAQALYDALGREDPSKYFRVSLAVAYIAPRSFERDIHLINRAGD